MDQPESSQNPYQPPESGKHNSAFSKQEPKPVMMVWMFVIPFFLSHTVFWPTMLVLSQLPTVRGDYGISAAMNALGIATIVGVIYGILISRFLARKNWRISVLYGLGQLLWFPCCIVAPCGILLLSFA